MIDHGTLVKWTKEADDATIDSRALSEQGRRYYDSEQWTAEEKRKLARQKQAATVSNRVKPKMDGLMGMERANRTTAKAFARTPKHEKGANAATEAVRFVLDDNFFNQKRSAAWENLLIEGTGGLEILVKPKGDNDYKVIINHIQWDRLIYDPHSRSKSFSDSPRYLGQVVWMDFDDAVEKYRDKQDLLETMQAGSTTYEDKPRWMDNDRKRCKIVELYYRDKGDWHYACFTRGGFLKGPMKSPYVNEEGETEHPYEFASLFVDGEGDRYGAEKQLIPIQDEVNKRRSKALHLMSVRQVRWERGAVDDINKARAELAKPDGVLETTPGMEFEILKTGDMAAAQFNLLAEAKSEIDAVSYNAAAAGKDNRNMSGVALRNRELSGQTEVAPMFDVLKHLDIRVYRKVWNRVKQYWKAEKWIRVTDDEHNLRWVGLNKPVTKGEMLLQQAQEAGAPPEQLAQMQAQLKADPMMQEVVSTENDIANLDVDIIMADAPDTVSQQVEDFQTLGEMVKSGFQMPPIAVIEASPLSNKDKIIKMMKEAPQMPPGLEEKMKQMQDGMQKLTEENRQLKMGAAEAQAKIAADTRIEEMTIAAEERSKERELRMEASFKERDARMEASFNRWEALLAARTKVEVAEIGKAATIETSQITAAKEATA